jgi:hypothetical protein
LGEDQYGGMEMSKEVQTKKQKFKTEINKFRTGDCDAFAIALFRLTEKKAPIYVVRGYFTEDGEEFYEDCHMVVKWGKDQYVDVDGEHTVQELKDRCYFNNPIERIELVKVSEEEARTIFSMEGVSEAQIERATQFFIEHTE